VGEWEAAFFRSPIPCCPLLLVCGADATRSERYPLLPPPLLTTCASTVLVERRDPSLPPAGRFVITKSMAFGRGGWFGDFGRSFCSPPTHQGVVHPQSLGVHLTTPRPLHSVILRAHIAVVGGIPPRGLGLGGGVALHGSLVCLLALSLLAESPRPPPPHHHPWVRSPRHCCRNPDRGGCPSTRSYQPAHRNGAGCWDLRPVGAAELGCVVQLLSNGSHQSNGRRRPAHSHPMHTSVLPCADTRVCVPFLWMVRCAVCGGRRGRRCAPRPSRV
jgi:hypothetical protein